MWVRLVRVLDEWVRIKGRRSRLLGWLADRTYGPL